MVLLFINCFIEKNDQEIEEINKEDIPVSNDCCECLKEENDYLRNKCESLLNLVGMNN